MSNSKNTNWVATGRISQNNSPYQVTTGSCQLKGWILNNGGSTATWLQIWDALSANITVGTNAPNHTLLIPAGSPAVVFPIEQGPGIQFSNAITVAATSTETGSTNPNANLSMEIFFI